MKMLPRVLLLAVLLGSVSTTYRAIFADVWSNPLVWAGWICSLIGAIILFLMAIECNCGGP